MRQRKKCTNRMTTTSRSFPPRDYSRRSHPRAFRRPSFQRASALARQKSNFQAIHFPSDYSSFSKGPLLIYTFIAANIIPRPAPLSSPLRKKLIFRLFFPNSLNHNRLRHGKGCLHATLANLAFLTTLSEESFLLPLLRTLPACPAAQIFLPILVHLCRAWHSRPGLSNFLPSLDHRLPPSLRR